MYILFEISRLSFWPRSKIIQNGDVNLCRFLLLNFNFTFCSMMSSKAMLLFSCPSQECDPRSFVFVLFNAGYFCSWPIHTRMVARRKIVKSLRATTVTRAFIVWDSTFFLMEWENCWRRGEIWFFLVKWRENSLH